MSAEPTGEPPLRPRHGSNRIDVSTRLTTRVIESLTEWEDIASEWESLLRRSTVDRVFLTHEWLTAWWEAFGGERRLFVICVWEAGVLVAGAPLCLTRSRLRGLPVRSLELLANGYTEESGFLCDADVPEALSEILSCLIERRKRWDLLHLSRIRLGTPLWHAKDAALRQAGIRVRTRSALRVPFIRIEGTWSEFLGRRSRKFRKTLRNRLNRATRHSPPIRIERVDEYEAIAKALPAIFDVSARSWKATTGTAITSSTEAPHFFEALVRRMAPRGRITLWSATRGDRIVAFEFHLTYQGVTSPIRADFDDAEQAQAVGAYLEAEILRRLFEDPEHPIHEYNSCAASYPYVEKWADQAHLHSEILATPPGLYGFVLHRLSGMTRPELEGPVEADSRSARPPRPGPNPLSRAIETLRSRGPRVFARRAFDVVRTRLVAKNAADWYLCHLDSREADRPQATAMGNADIDFGARDVKEWLRALKPEFGWTWIREEMDVAEDLEHLFPLVRVEGRNAGYMKVATSAAWVDDFETILPIPAACGYVYDSFIHPDFRGRGLARWMIARTLDELATRGVERVWCHIPRWNRASIAAYEHAGFVRIASIRHLRFLGWRFYSRDPATMLREVTVRDG